MCLTREPLTPIYSGAIDIPRCAGNMSACLTICTWHIHDLDATHQRGRLIMLTTYDVLHRLIEDAHKYEVLSKRAARSVVRKPSGVGPDDELAGVLGEIARLSHSQAIEAKRLLAQQQRQEESLLRQAD